MLACPNSASWRSRVFYKSGRVKYNCRSVKHQKAPEHILSNRTLLPTIASNGAARTRRPARETAMKLIVQIPVLNEADTIAEVIRDIPRHIPGVDIVEVLIV